MYIKTASSDQIHGLGRMLIILLEAKLVVVIAVIGRVRSHSIATVLYIHQDSGTSCDLETHVPGYVFMIVAHTVYNLKKFIK